MNGYSHICAECKRYRKCRKCDGRWLCEECHPLVCTRHGRKGRMEGEMCCQDCRHCLMVTDQFRGHVKRGCCVLLQLMVAHLGSAAGCSNFEPKVPQAPHLGKPRTLSGHPLFTEEDLVKEIRLAMMHVENLLKALELQPRTRAATTEGLRWD